MRVRSRLKLGVLAAVVVAAGVVWWVKFSHGSPRVEFAGNPEFLGRSPALDMTVHVPGWPGLRRIAVDLVAQGQRYKLFSEDVPATGFLGSRVNDRQVRIQPDLGALGVPEGPAVLEVFADTYAWHIVPSRDGPDAVRPVTLDLTPPVVEVLSTVHNIRLGGASVAVFKVSEDAIDSGVAVGDYYFPAVRGFYTDPNAMVAIFAVPQDLSVDARPAIQAKDRIGNTRTVELPSHIKSWPFREATITLDDQFLQRKVPELLAANALPAQPDLLAGYLQINRELRKKSEARLKEVTAKSVPEPLWDGRFRRQSNAAPMSGFADRRTYIYRDQQVDHQTHLGFDLASVQRAPVEAAQNGIVVLADDLGIYGGTVVIDHGLGVFSLYGHLSSILVKSGQQVRAGEAIGQSGSTGLAGGDHLHFSIMIHGVHVDPREWWDPKWLHDHVAAKLDMLPRAKAVTAAAPPPAPAAPEAPPHEQARP